jgi:hypothetical protein
VSVILDEKASAEGLSDRALVVAVPAQVSGHPESHLSGGRDTARTRQYEKPETGFA